MRNLKTYVFLGLGLLLVIPNLLAQQSSTSTIQQKGSVNLPILKLSKIPDSALQLSPYSSIYLDPTRNLLIDSARTLWAAGHFDPLLDLNYPPKFESGKYHYWLQFQIENTSVDTLNLILRLSRLDSNFYYQFIDNQLDRKVLFGNKLAWKEQMKFNFDLQDAAALPIELLPQKHYQIFVRTSDNLYLTTKIRPELKTAYLNLKSQAIHQLPVTLIDGFLLGILLFLTFSSLLQYSQNKDKAFLFYGIYVGITFLQYWVLFDYSNSTVKILQPLMADRNYIKVPIEVGMIMSYLLFMQYFLNEKKQFPFFGKFIRFFLKFSGIYVIASILISLVEVRLSWIYHYYFLGIVIIMSLILLYQIYKMHTKLSFYIFWGMMSLLVFSMIVPSFFRLGYLEKSLIQFKDIDYLLRQIGVFIELLFFSLGLGYKQLIADQEKVIIEQEKEQLTQLKLFKSKFYTNLTHEFRTPLTIILGITNVLKSNIINKDFKGVEKSIEMIHRNGKNLLELVNKMLDLAKNESGNLVLKLKKGDVIPFTKYISESFHSLAEAKQINLVVYTEVEALEMDFDEDKLAIILSNLLSNAIKFTEAHGKIIIHLNRKKVEGLDYFSIKIKDNGIGISAAALPNIFNRYYQSTNSAERSNEGTGIGLSFTKELVTLMDGTIAVNSQEGKGAEFIINIPILQNTIDLKETENTISLIPSFTDTYENNLPISQITALDLPLVLIIEDNEDVAHYLSTCLATQYQIIHAKNGQIGIDMAFEKIPDVIISDVMMPKKDGFEVCHILKTDERTDHIPIILLTAKVTVTDRLKGLTQGADAYLIKPFEKAELLIRLENLILTRSKLQEKLKAGLINIKTLDNTEKPITSFLQKAEKIILDNLSNDDFSVNELARHLHLSRSQIHRKIKALTGMSTAIYIRFIRLEKAKILLSFTELSISEIAYQVGFKSPVYFSQVYKEKYGESPNTTRK